MIRELVTKARSTRRFNQTKPVTRGQLLELVDIARLCPCGGNQQPLRYRLISEAQECRMIFPHISWAGALPDWDGPEEGERPTGYICIVGPEKHPTDVGIAGQTIQLAATEMGLGCCMLGAIRRNKIHRILALPEMFQVNLLIAVGIPAETVVIDEADDDQLRYYRDDQGVHHVPKRKIEDLVIPHL